MALAMFGLAASGARAQAGCNLVERAELPVIMIGPRSIVAATVNGQAGFFAIDSGAFYSLLSPEAADRLRLQQDELSRRVNIVGVGGSMDARIATVHKFGIGGLTVPDLDFLTGGGTLFDDQIIGALGQNFLSLYDVEFDLANGVIRLFDAKGNCGRTAPVYWSKTFGAIDVERPTFARPNVVGAVTINGKKLYATFDTGAPNSILSLKAAAKAGQTPTSPGVTAAGTTWGGGPRQLDAWEAPIARVEMGGEVIANTRLRMADLDLNGESDLLIGADFFLSHRVYLSASQHRLYFTYNGGNVFARYAAGPRVAAPDLPADADADALVRRGAADLARADYPRAIAAFTRAIALQPTVARHFHDRALAYLADHQPEAALRDADEAVRLRPDDSPSLMLRAGLELERHDEARARADFDAALAVPGADPNGRLAVAETYLRAGAYPDAITQLDAWIVAHPRHDLLASALAARCEARADAGRELDQALADCNAALKRQGRVTAVLALRAQVYLRLNRLDEAVADFDAALKAQPKLASALYGRGLAEDRKGLKPQAAADLAAAVALDKTQPETALKLGLIPAAPAT